MAQGSAGVIRPYEILKVLGDMRPFGNGGNKFFLSIFYPLYNLFLSLPRVKAMKLC